MLVRPSAAFILAVFLALPPATAAAGVTDGRSPLSGTQNGSHTLKCWQNGVKIIDEKDLGSLAATPAQDLKGLSFAPDRAGSTVLVILDGNTACFVRRTS